mmetsp:Transcript_6131/g.11332  ORF Transcript_6131/g.11332 Transcript_6131/m.11332 type:complete len:384 (-) Transcript_6131:243-1394(-)
MEGCRDYNFPTTMLVVRRSSSDSSDRYRYRMKSSFVGGSPTRASSPRSVLDDPFSCQGDQYRQKNIISSSNGQTSVTSTTLVGAKRKFPFDASPSMNLRHRLVCDETVEWLHSSSQVEELWLGPVFESSQTVLSAISTLPCSVTHLDLDLRNALHLLPQAMPLLFSKRHLKTLSVRLFGDSGAVELARWINKNATLEQLDLRGNRIGSFGAQAILEALIECGDHKLKQLNLSCNCILDGDMIGGFLESSNNLKILDLGFNWLGDQEVEEICKGLRSNTSLEELNLFGCRRISNRGLRTILDCVKHHNTSLHKVHVKAFDEEGERLVREIDHWVSLNKAGRYLMKSQDPVPVGLWQLVLEKSSRQPGSLFFLIREASPKMLHQC